MTVDTSELPKSAAATATLSMAAAEGLPRGVLTPSAAYALPQGTVKGYVAGWAQPPALGDVMLGQLRSIGAHQEIENRQGRIHQLNEGFLALFVYGNRYATDAFEALIPDRQRSVVDLIARSGVIGTVETRNSNTLHRSRSLATQWARMIYRSTRCSTPESSRLRPRRPSLARS